jgi:glycosyltransferase involved in cell wall biosynthesis
VAVIVPVFNRLDLLRSTVASLRAQTVPDAEFILVDDNSEQSVWDFLLSLPREDPRFQVMRKPEGAPRGPQASRNIGLDVARAEAVMMLDSDDLLAPGCLEERYAVLAENPVADVVVGRQAIFSEVTGAIRWVNIPKPAVSDLDRFLELTHPLDVPWVNGGVILRTRSLRAAGVRFRPEFSWDDVAFHFECLVAGLTTIWMPYDGLPDAYYRRHDGETRGQALFTPSGMRNSARMFEWMRQELAAAGQMTDSRNRALARSFYNACVLPAIDAGDYALARELTTEATDDGLLTSQDAFPLRMYCGGRSLFRKFPRITYYWNRFSDEMLLTPFLSTAISTYNSIPADGPSPEALPGALSRGAIPMPRLASYQA